MGQEPEGGLVQPGEAYVTRDGSTVVELVRPERGGSRNVSVARAIVEPGQPTQRHYHTDSDEVYYVLQGTGAVRLGDRWLPVEPAATVFIPAGLAHEARCDGPTPLVILCICSPPYTHEQTVLEPG